MAQAQRLKRSPASLFGAFVIAAGVFALWLLITRELGLTESLYPVLGAVAAAAIGVWVRLVDL